MPTVDFHPEAADEAVAAQKWYADVDPTLGVEFSDALERAIFLIETTPQRWTQHLHGTR